MDFKQYGNRCVIKIIRVSGIGCRELRRPGFGIQVVFGNPTHEAWNPVTRFQKPVASCQIPGLETLRKTVCYQNNPGIGYRVSGAGEFGISGRRGSGHWFRATNSQLGVGDCVLPNEFFEVNRNPDI